MLYLIGIGLGNEKDLTLRALEALKKCSHVYLENYTSIYRGDLEKLEKLIGNKVIFADRDLIESKFDEILENDSAVLIMGDVFSATTHVDMVMRAKEKNIGVKIIHNCSIMTAIGETGLSLYKFGKTTSIPFDRKVETPLRVIKDNSKMHTLVLLDIKPNERTMRFSEAVKFLGLKDRMFVGCCGLGLDESKIVYGSYSDLVNLDLDIYPQCLIVVGDLHFMEEEALERFKV